MHVTCMESRMVGVVRVLRAADLGVVGVVRAADLGAGGDRGMLIFLLFLLLHCHSFFFLRSEGRAKSSVTNRLTKFYPRYILKCFTALEWCVE